MSANILSNKQRKEAKSDGEYARWCAEQNLGSITKMETRFPPKDASNPPMFVAFLQNLELIFPRAKTDDEAIVGEGC